MRLLSRAALAVMVFSSIGAVLGAGSTKSALADDHLPIIDLTPTLGYGLAGASGGPVPLNGKLTFDGTATLPIIKNLTFSYDKFGNGAWDSPQSSVAIAGQTVYPGGSRDMLQNFRADYRSGPFTFESGFASRYRECCPADAVEWHKGFLGVNYTTPRLHILHGGVFVLDLTANATHHVSSPAALAALPPNLSLPNNTEILTTQQSITAVVPIDARGRLTTAATFLWGALDYPQNGPFPLYYDVVVTSATKRVNRNVGITLTVANVKQRIQGYPFPAPNAIRTAAFTLMANFKLDLNRLLAAQARTPSAH